MDQIFIRNLEFYGYHGASDEEQVIGHRYVLNATLHVDTRRAGETDSLTETVNYAEVAALALKVSEAHQFRLIEALLHVMARDIFATFPPIQSLELSVAKRLPPMPAIAEEVGVTIFRNRIEFPG